MCNLIEVRSDAFKLAFICQRPRAMRAKNIGMWGAVLTAQVWLSALTNCFLFGFSSMQMMQWIPHLFVIAADGDQELAAGSGRSVDQAKQFLSEFQQMRTMMAKMAGQAPPDGADAAAAPDPDALLNRAARRAKKKKGGKRKLKTAGFG